MIWDCVLEELSPQVCFEACGPNMSKDWIIETEVIKQNAINKKIGSSVKKASA